MKSIALVLPLLALSFTPGCGEAHRFSDAARPSGDAASEKISDGSSDLVLSDQAIGVEPDVPVVEDPVDAAEPTREDAAAPEPEGDAGPVQSYQCGDGYLCLTSCENRCGLHELGRSTCLCKDGVLQCNDCQITALARPQVPENVSATCGASVASGSQCSQVGEACFVDPGSPYPAGCLCWPTATGLIWNCAPVFGWFSLPPDAGR